MRVPAGVLGILVLVLAGCAAMGDYWRNLGRDLVDTTYEKFRASAQAGDAESQNLIGVMLFFGEGVPRNRLIAHWWFHKAADQSNARAQRNLAIMHSLGPASRGTTSRPSGTSAWPRRTTPAPRGDAGRFDRTRASPIWSSMPPERPGTGGPANRPTRPSAPGATD